MKKEKKIEFLIECFQKVSRGEHKPLEENLKKKMVHEFCLWFYHQRTKPPLTLNKLLEGCLYVLKTKGLFDLKNPIQGYLIFFEIIEHLFRIGLFTFKDERFQIKKHCEKVVRIKKKDLMKLTS